MSLGFSIETLLPAARVKGPLRMGLKRLDESQWLQPAPNLSVRNERFDARGDNVIVMPEAEKAGRELAQMLGVKGGLAEAARSTWEDLCILTRSKPDEIWRLTGGAVAFPTDWALTDKIGKPMLAVHEPIHGYAEHLAAGVDSFMNGLADGQIFGRANVFVTASNDLRYLPIEDAELRFAHATAENAGDTLFVRCERQTLRRLPVSDAIVFTIGIYCEPLRNLSNAAVQYLAQSLDGFGVGEGTRRASPHYAAALAGYAATCKETQERSAA